MPRKNEPPMAASAPARKVRCVYIDTSSEEYRILRQEVVEGARAFEEAAKAAMLYRLLLQNEKDSAEECNVQPMLPSSAPPAA